MQFVAKSRFVKFSPYKLRDIVDVVRGKSAHYALAWLASCARKRAVPVKKMIDSAVANAKMAQSLNASNLIIAEIRVDEGPMQRYFKPGAMGRSNVYRRRLSHMSIVLKPANVKEA